MGVALYDATKVAGLFSRNKAQVQHANYLEDVYYNSRTLDTVSYSSNGIRKTTANVMEKNPLPRIWGRIKGAFQGATYSLGHNLLAIACASLALVSKGKLAIVGAAGLGLGACYKIAREGLGVGKTHPMR